MKDNKFKYLEASVDFGFRGILYGVWDVFCDNLDDYAMYYIVAEYYDQPDSLGNVVTWEKVIFLSYQRTEADPKFRDALRIHSSTLNLNDGVLRVSPYLRESCFSPLGAGPNSQ
jgi:hypothetical protein